ncbi:MAG: hypothetical protein F4Z94_03585 [Chloroflexi bacterium]|nr:hypothetical protein [Chloroflexota bacterium]MXX50148.1 hypothetical protein [Chloroflexota bacterium]MYC54447.1 hypothetical protein [Chloroflexota bacterium]
MNNRSVISIASLALLLTLLLALAPVQAAHNCPNPRGTCYDQDTRVNNLKFDRFTGNDFWIISWDTVPGEHEISMQYIGRPTDVWNTLWIRDIKRGGGKTEATVWGHRPRPGTTIRFRLRMSSRKGLIIPHVFKHTF